MFFGQAPRAPAELPVSYRNPAAVVFVLLPYPKSTVVLCYRSPWITVASPSDIVPLRRFGRRVHPYPCSTVVFCTTVVLGLL